VHKSTTTFVIGNGEWLVINSDHLSYQSVNFHRLQVIEISHTAALSPVKAKSCHHWKLPPNIAQQVTDDDINF